ncbi:adenylate kinase [Balnearium lithotrophicum]|uniref:Adenylate kinase n=1 Tax=Balnearium lithotrophicum TaxID=223788 RepID=A0A521C296_9BACT|nr:adenylate kinase family protein [Balnearium lithotrophicum]SMO53597.1 adenylate kinase [Balnearium lithotrophicum]
MRIAITGTPGTGKTTVSRILSKKLSYPVYSLSELVKREKLYSEFDERRNSYVVDIEKLKGFFKGKENFIAEGLVSHYIPVDLIVVLRAKPETIRERLKERNYSKEKVEENVEAERIGFIATEVFEGSGKARVVQIDTTRRTPEEVAGLIGRALKGEEVFDDVDWLEDEEGGN